MAIRSLDELFQSAVDAPRYQLVASARENLGIVMNYLNFVTGKVQTAVITMAAIGTFVAADGEVSDEEFEFMRDVLQSDLSYDAFFASAQAAVNSNMDNKINTLIDNAPDDVKIAFCILCVDFIACDGTITPTEKQLLLKYLA